MQRVDLRRIRRFRVGFSVARVGTTEQVINDNGLNAVFRRVDAQEAFLDVVCRVVRLVERDARRDAAHAARIVVRRLGVVADVIARFDDAIDHLSEYSGDYISRRNVCWIFRCLDGIINLVPYIVFLVEEDSLFAARLGIQPVGFVNAQPTSVVNIVQRTLRYERAIITAPPIHRRLAHQRIHAYVQIVRIHFIEVELHVGESPRRVCCQSSVRHRGQGERVPSLLRERGASTLAAHVVHDVPALAADRVDLSFGSVRRVTRGVCRQSDALRLVDVDVLDGNPENSVNYDLQNFCNCLTFYFGLYLAFSCRVSKTEQKMETMIHTFISATLCKPSTFVFT